MMTTDLVISPKEFFRNQVEDASRSLKIYLGDDLEFYVVNLLCDFINPSHIDEILSSEDGVLGTPLAFILKEADESSDLERKLTILKRLGDTSLYISGYFQDYFNRKTFDISYYIEMGAMAYDRAASLRRGDDKRTYLYNDLSEHFGQLVDVVAEIADSVRPETHQNILSIYDRWHKSNSTRLLKLLQDHGINPLPAVKKAQ